MATTPRHRWNQFSLRKMFVLVFIVSVPLAWVGYQLNWIRQRREFINNHFGCVGNPIVGYEAPLFGPIAWPMKQSAPAGLRLWGETGFWLIRCDPKDIELAKRLFPEAQVIESPSYEPSP
jgi:hypothetical protein